MLDTCFFIIYIALQSVWHFFDTKKENKMRNHLFIPVFAVLAIAAILVGCAGTKIERNSLPGLDINGKKLWVLVDDQKAYTGYTTKLDSLWKTYGEKNHLEIEFRKNEALALEPISPRLSWRNARILICCRQPYPANLKQTSTTPLPA